MDSTKDMSDVLKDFPQGPLDLYRTKASFDWKKMKLFIFGENRVRYEVRSCTVLFRI